MPEVMQKRGVKAMQRGQHRNAEYEKNSHTQKPVPQNLLQDAMQTLLDLPSTAHGMNMVPDKECLCYQLNIPQDMTLSEVQQAIFEEQARELGLDNVKAQKLLEISHRNAQEHARAHKQQVAAWGDEVRHDRELGGSSMESTLAYARAGLAKFDPQRKLYQVLQETGYANHPIVIRFLSAIGRAHAEDAVLLGSTVPTTLPRHERLYGKYNK